MRQAVMMMLVVAVGLVDASAAPPSDALSYAVFAIQQASVGSRARIEGDTGCFFDALSLGQGTRVTGAAAAPTITLRRHARATGGYFCGTIEGTKDTCMTLPNPLVAAPPIVLVGPSSSTDVSVDKRTKSTAPLAPGIYGTLSAGTAAELTLAGGTYQFESIDLGARARLVCVAACDVTVRGAVKAGQASRLGATDGVPAASAILRIAAQGENRALDLKSRARVRGTVYAPSADVRLGAATRVTGAVVGNTVSVGPRARLQGPPGGA